MMTNYLFIVASLIIFSSNTQPAMSRAHDNTTDLESLLAFKSGVYDPYDFLATNWTTNASFCSSWFGVECSHGQQRVIKLYIHNLSLYGTVCPHLGNLSFLSYLNLGINNLTGNIPDSIARLPRLAFLGLHSNNLSGSIPPSMFNMSSMTQLSLASNRLSGSLPSKNDLFVLPKLEFFSLSLNNFTGGIPSQLAQCSHLWSLSLSYNKLGGEIPPELGNLTMLEKLYLGANRLSGKIPASMGNLTVLRSLSISLNNLQGSIPDEMGNLLHLQKLQLRDNSLSGSMPTALLNASNLDYVELDQNKISGVIPTSLGKSWPQMTYLSMFDNQLYGGLDFITSLSDCRNLNTVQLAYNELDGVIPDSIGNLSTNLRKLHLRHNYIKGKVPIGIGNLSGLFYLFIEENELTGEVPPSLSMLKSLQGVSLRRNKIGGKIPVELGRMTSLNQLDLSHNAISGSIPYSLGNITTLYNLNLASNRLFSNIPESLWSLNGLLGLDLSENALDGLLSLQMGKLKFLDSLDLSTNRLSGNIPSSLGDLQMLTYLNLFNNSFYGQIPMSIKGLINIEHLNLSYNSLSGTIPEFIVNLTYLGSLDLSFNKLQGQIPQGGSFSNLNVLSLEGNSALCGAIQLGFPPCPSNFGTTHSKVKVYLFKYIFPTIAFLAILAVGFYIRLILRQRRSRKLELTAPLNEFSIIPYYELVRATGNFSDANLLGRGSFSSVFKAYLDDGTIIAVKVLNLEDHSSLKSFDIECSILGAVRHRNLVKIISTCSNLDFKALILEFMSNGSLEQLLYSHNNYLSLLQRLNIMVDVPLALEYLHHDHPNTVLHCDLKPSNVLFNENMTAHVSDFGISKLLLGDSKSILSTSAPGTFGYMALEYGSTGKVSRKSDVYSFGVLMLEILTRKKPSDAMFDGGLSLRQWVGDSYPSAVLNIVDPNILAEGSTVHVHQCLASLIEVALKCSRNLPKERFLIKEVVPILQKIKMNYISNN